MEKKNLYICIREHLDMQLNEHHIGERIWIEPSRITISKVQPCWRKATKEELSEYSTE